LILAFCVRFLMAAAASSAGSAAVLLPPAIDGDVREWDAPADSAVGLTTCADRIYLRISLPEAVVLQSGSGVVIYYDTDDNPATGLPAHGLGAEVRWDAGIRSGMRYTADAGVLTGRSIRHADLGLRAAPVLDSRDFEVSILRAEAGAGTCRVAVEWNGQLLDVASADYRGERLVRSLSAVRAAHTDLRVLAYNVLSDGFPASNTRRPRFFAEFEALQPDIICFTEIYNHSAETTRARVAEVLPYMLHASGDGSWDSRMISRHAILFSESSDRFHAGRVRSEDGSIDVMVITAHLSCCDNDGARADQLAAIGNLVARLRSGQLAGVPVDLPVVLAGDFNLVRRDTAAFLALQQGAGLRPLSALHLDAAEDYTWRSDGSSYSPGRLDYILAGTGLVGRRAFVHKSENPPSDHLPLVADLAIDADANGLADGWERFHFGAIGQSPSADPDSDGFRNADEQRLGAHPLRGTDRPQLVATSDGGVVQLRLPAHGQGRATFRLWRSTNLTGWQAVSGRWRPDDAALSVPLSGPAAFFRATLEAE